MRVLSWGLFLSCLALVSLQPRGSAADDAATDVFNGKDLSGWQEKKGGGSLAGKAEAYKGRFRVADGVLTIDPKVKGDLRIVTDRMFAGDLVLTFEFNPGAGCNNDLFLRGQKFDLKKPDVKNLKEGGWNAFEIAIKGDAITFKNNGEVQRAGKTKGDSSPLEIRAEFGPVQFRKIRVTGGGK